MTELRALTRECELRSYSRLRKAKLIAFLRQNLPMTTSSNGSAPTERQLKRRHAKDAKSSKKYTKLRSQINNLKSQLESLNEKITHIFPALHTLGSNTNR